MWFAAYAALETVLLFHISGKSHLLTLFFCRLLVTEAEDEGVVRGESAQQPEASASTLTFQIHLLHWTNRAETDSRSVTVSMYLILRIFFPPSLKSHHKSFKICLNCRSTEKYTCHHSESDLRGRKHELSTFFFMWVNLNVVFQGAHAGNQRAELIMSRADWGKLVTIYGFIWLHGTLKTLMGTHSWFCEQLIKICFWSSEFT